MTATATCARQVQAVKLHLFLLERCSSSGVVRD